MNASIIEVTGDILYKKIVKPVLEIVTGFLFSGFIDRVEPIIN